MQYVNKCLLLKNYWSMPALCKGGRRGVSRDGRVDRQIDIVCCRVYLKCSIALLSWYQPIKFIKYILLQSNPLVKNLSVFDSSPYAVEPRESKKQCKISLAPSTKF